MGLTDKNLFAYCDNNPVTRIDQGGQLWWDVVSFFMSVGELIANPTDPWAWAGAVGDAIDLLPGVTGVGETTRVIKVVTKSDEVIDAVKAVAKADDVGDILKTVSKSDDVVGAAKAVLKNADEASNLCKTPGAYQILYKSGYSYIGKGDYNRAIYSSMQKATLYTDEVVAIMWQSAPDTRTAFIYEYLIQDKFGGPRRIDGDVWTYNKIWSPGRKYYGK